MVSGYLVRPQRIRDLNGLGLKTEELIAKVGINSVDQFMAIDPFDLYALLKSEVDVSLNFMYAILGARENISWIEIKNSRKIEILMRLDDMGLAPN